MENQKIVQTGLKVDFHIHSYASKHKEGKGVVDDSTIKNIGVLIKKLNDRNINMCSISDHDNFDINIYKRLKQEENNGCIKKVFPAVEFSVLYDKKVIHIITIFDDSDISKLETLKKLIFDSTKNRPNYDKPEKLAFSEEKYLNILREVGLNVVMIAHQKGTPNSKEPKNHDVKSLGDDRFDELVFLDYFESLEFQNKRNEIFNKDYIEKNKEKYKDKTLRFITGSDCHNWKNYPDEDDTFSFTYLKCLPTFRGLAMAITCTRRINYVNNFYSQNSNFLRSISISIDEKKYDIEMSKGINVVIGDNSIGKSLLIHKLTNYKYLKGTKLKNYYEKYLKVNKINVNTIIPNNSVSRFDAQGAIRKMFEDKKINTQEFLNSFFPQDPLVKKCADTYKSSVDSYIEVLKNKENNRINKEKIFNLKLLKSNEKSKSLNLQKIAQTVINNFTQKNSTIGEIVEKFETINEDLQLILKNKYFLEEDKDYIDKVITHNTLLIKKYKELIIKNEKEINKMNIINTLFETKNKDYSKTKTDESEKIAKFENDKSNFAISIFNYYESNKKKLKFEPNIMTEHVPYSKREVGNYRFVTKAGITEISNDGIIDIIKETLGISYKDINAVSSEHIPQRFNEKDKELTYEEKLNNLKQSIYEKIDEKFFLVKSINDVKDGDAERDLSAGFNARMYFDIITNDSDSKGIYIVDQPEDDLSQLAIKNNIIKDFIAMSKNRQIIMITHNPQLIMNLDVDNVIYIGKDNKDNIIIQNGSLEYYEEENGYDMLKIIADNIDGGIESINERWKRYEKNIYNV